MQNILIINGSPRKNGNISKMLEAIKEETEKQGANVSSYPCSRFTGKDHATGA